MSKAYHLESKALINYSRRPFKQFVIIGGIVSVHASFCHKSPAVVNPMTNSGPETTSYRWFIVTSSMSQCFSCQGLELVCFSYTYPTQQFHRRLPNTANTYVQLFEHNSVWQINGHCTTAHIQCELKKSPLWFSDIFPKSLGIFNKFFTHLLIWHKFIKIWDNWLKICNLALIGMYKRCIKNWVKILNHLWKNVKKPQLTGGGDFFTHTVEPSCVKK